MTLSLSSDEVLTASTRSDFALIAANEAVSSFTAALPDFRRTTAPLVPTVLMSFVSVRLPVELLASADASRVTSPSFVTTPTMLVPVGSNKVVIPVTSPTVKPSTSLTLIDFVEATNCAARVPISLAVLSRVILPASVRRPSLVALTVPASVWVRSPAPNLSTTCASTELAVIPSRLVVVVAVIEPSLLAVRVVTVTRSMSRLWALSSSSPPTLMLAARLPMRFSLFRREVLVEAT